jgi:hypothetical protein
MRLHGAATSAPDSTGRSGPLRCPPRGQLQSPSPHTSTHHPPMHPIGCSCIWAEWMVCTQPGRCIPPRGMQLLSLGVHPTRDEPPMAACRPVEETLPTVMWARSSDAPPRCSYGKDFARMMRQVPRCMCHMQLRQRPLQRQLGEEPNPMRRLRRCSYETHLTMLDYAAISDASPMKAVRRTGRCAPSSHHITSMRSFRHSYRVRSASTTRDFHRCPDGAVHSSSSFRHAWSMFDGERRTALQQTTPHRSASNPGGVEKAGWRPDHRCRSDAPTRAVATGGSSTT